jgi:chromosome segregation ATPase
MMSDMELIRAMDAEAKVEELKATIEELEEQLDDVIEGHLRAGIASRKRIKELETKITEYKGDREFFQKRDMQQCREISRNHIKIEQLQAQLARIKDAIDKKFIVVFDVDRNHIRVVKCETLKEALQEKGDG